MVHIHKITKKDRNIKPRQTNLEKYGTYKICVALRIQKRICIQHDQVIQKDQRLPAKLTDNCFGLHSPGIFFSGIQINFSFFFPFPCCCNIPDIKFACFTVHKSISGSLPGPKHVFYIHNLFAKVQVFLELTHFFFIFSLLLACDLSLSSEQN